VLDEGCNCCTVLVFDPAPWLVLSNMFTSVGIQLLIQLQRTYIKDSTTSCNLDIKLSIHLVRLWWSATQWLLRIFKGRNESNVEWSLMNLGTSWSSVFDSRRVARSSRNSYLSPSMRQKAGVQSFAQHPVVIFYVMFKHVFFSFQAWWPYSSLVGCQMFLLFIFCSTFQHHIQPKKIL
jgi:hypothetical protein